MFGYNILMLTNQVHNPKNTMIYSNDLVGNKTVYADINWTWHTNTFNVRFFLTVVQNLILNINVHTGLMQLKAI